MVKDSDSSRPAGRRGLRLALFALLLLPGLAGFGHTAAAFCAGQHPGGVAPAIVRPQLAAETRELCFREFAVIHSGISRTPLAVAEHLTRAQVQAARKIGRENNFHDEDALPPEHRARLGDYARSGFDRGHMAPSGDMPTPEAQAESFSLANMVPQHPGSNRCLWEGIESSVRELAMQDGEVWILTGPIFEGGNLQRLNGRVLVPTSLYKAIYVPSRQQAGAYVAPNAPGMEWRAVSLAELRGLTGIDAFPSLPKAVQDRAMTLPEPKPSNVRGSCDREGAAVASTQPRGGSSGRGHAAPQGGGGQGMSTGGIVSLVLAALFALGAGVVLYRILGRR
ncbi:Endonuclease [Rhodovastum atsumiense]|uniref:Endonuclease n=1 Tax=Rhodovastum atsumiense TaxID=504468 RepID=A0A5M6IKT9_9PROT|nr:DNA/RNA non-specific endonuclease [Rhodovastum atsumiense]KAA5608881.1 DNA/RNA non-specific endonuclease [Rhodovastum atsumiense]CAH2602321.1 Endonuclease [Rhodovastum atsumiense]